MELSQKLGVYAVYNTIPDPYGLSFPIDWGIATPPQNCNHYYVRNG